MVDPSIRLQNIALEHEELVARRSMCWTEATNRTTMLMTVVSAAVVALALVAQTNAADAELVALVILPVVLVIGLSSLARIGALDREDMRWVQGLNRLRSLRLELDPDLAPYLVTVRTTTSTACWRPTAPASRPARRGRWGWSQPGSRRSSRSSCS